MTPSISGRTSRREWRIRGGPLLRAEPQKADRGHRKCLLRAIRLGLAVLVASVISGIGTAYSQPVPEAFRGSDQPVDSLRAALHLPVTTSIRSAYMRRVAPAMGASSPTGFGARAGDLHVGAALQWRARSYWRADGTQVDPPIDGAVAAGVGLGNPEKVLGLQVDVISFSTVRSGFGTNMGVDLKVHRVFPHQISVALGYESAFVRGETDSGSSRYAVISKWTALREDPEGVFGSLVISAGLGDGRFRPVAAWNEESSRPYPFGSIGLRIFEPLSLIADWTGQDLAIVASVAPFRRLPAVASLGFRDIAGSGYPNPRFVAAGSYLLRYPIPF
jgi:hypothetical protein